MKVILPVETLHVLLLSGQIYQELEQYDRTL